MGLIQYTIKSSGTFYMRVACLGPLFLILGPVVVILGKPDNVFKNAVYLIAAVVGLIVGIVYMDNLKTGKPSFLVATVNTISESLHLTDHVVTKTEVDAAAAEVASKALELNKRTKLLDKNDAQAVHALNQEVAAYTKRNHEVKALLEAYNAQSNAAAAFRSQVVGKWKSSTDFHDGFVETNIATYAEDGAWMLYVQQKQGQITNDATLKGRWRVSGRTLIVSVESSSNPHVKKSGGINQFAIDEINGDEMHLLSDDRVSITKYRVK